MKKEELRSFIIKEMEALLQDDALFIDREIPGILPDRDIPGDHSPGRNLSYGHVKSSDHEGRSTKKQLYYIFRKAQSLYDMIEDDDDLPEWVQSKISRAADKIQSVHEYLEYKIHRDY